MEYKLVGLRKISDNDEYYYFNISVEETHYSTWTSRILSCKTKYYECFVHKNTMNKPRFLNDGTEISDVYKDIYHSIQALLRNKNINDGEEYVIN